MVPLPCLAVSTCIDTYLLVNGCRNQFCNLTNVDCKVHSQVDLPWFSTSWEYQSKASPLRHVPRYLSWAKAFILPEPSKRFRDNHRSTDATKTLNCSKSG